MVDKWSQDVTEHSDALNIEPGLFKEHDPAVIARGLKKAAEASTRRKGTPLQSAMGMLTFYINRAGHNLPKSQLKILEVAKDELHRLFNAD